MATEITISELRAEYERLLSSQPQASGFTSHEWSREWGIAQETAQRRIKQAVANGVLVYAGRKRMTKVDGSTQTAPCYTIAEKPSGKSKR